MGAWQWGGTARQQCDLASCEPISGSDRLSLPRWAEPRLLGSTPHALPSTPHSVPYIALSASKSAETAFSLWATRCVPKKHLILQPCARPLSL